MLATIHVGVVSSGQSIDLTIQQSHKVVNEKSRIDMTRFIFTDDTTGNVIDTVEAKTFTQALEWASIARYEQVSCKAVAA